MTGAMIRMPGEHAARLDRHSHFGGPADNLTFSTTRAAATGSTRSFRAIAPGITTEEVISGSAVEVSAYVTGTARRGSKRSTSRSSRPETGGTGDEQAGQLAAYEIVNSRGPGRSRSARARSSSASKTGDCITLDCPDQGLDAAGHHPCAEPRSGHVQDPLRGGGTETEEKHDFALGKTTTPPSTYAPTPPDLTPPTPSAVPWTLSAPTDANHPTIVVAGACEFTGADSGARRIPSHRRDRLVIGGQVRRRRAGQSGDNGLDGGQPMRPGWPTSPAIARATGRSIP